jgi:mRNA interferase MazF
LKPRPETWPKRGEVWLAGLDPVIGAEQGKTRPVIVIQNDIANQFSPVVIVAAVTSATGEKEYPTEVRLHKAEGRLKPGSTVLLNQIRTIDKRRLIQRWGSLSRESLARVEEALKISLGLVQL